MKQYIIEQLRKLSCVPGKEKTWISKLDDEQLFNLYLKLRNGDSARSIASYLQKALQTHTASSIRSMAQGISTFKKRIAHLLVDLPAAPEIQDTPHDLDEGNALERMEIMAERYEARIKKIMEEEAKTGIRYPHLNRDIQSLASLRKSIIKHKEWEMKYGEPLRERIEREKDPDRDYKFKQLSQKLGQDGRQRLVQAMDRFLDLASQHVVKMKFDKQLGKYKSIAVDKCQIDGD